MEIDRNIGSECRHFYREYVNTGFFNKYMKGVGLDIGFQGYVGSNIVPILPGATGIDIGYPGYDGITLPFADKTQDYVFSSHCLEHISDYKNAMQDWYRVVKTNGYIIIIVPHQFAYEKRKELPSRWNRDHKRFYTLAKLVSEIEEALDPNTYRIVSAKDRTNDDLVKYPPKVHSNGPYEIEVVVRKINKPEWDLE